MNELSAVPDEKAQEADEGDAGCGAHARCHRKGEAVPRARDRDVLPVPSERARSGSRRQRSREERPMKPP